MRCPFCGASIPRDARFCGRCGGSLPSPAQAFPPFAFLFFLFMFAALSSDLFILAPRASILRDISVAFSTDEEHVASLWGIEGHLWEASSGRLLAFLEEVSAPGYRIRFSPDGRL